MPRYQCAILQNGGVLCQATVDIRYTRQGYVPGWAGAVVASDPPDAIWQSGKYTLRLEDGSEHAAIINNVQIGSGGTRISFRGATGLGPGAPSE